MLKIVKRGHDYQEIPQKSNLHFNLQKNSLKASSLKYAEADSEAVAEAESEAAANLIWNEMYSLSGC